MTRQDSRAGQATVGLPVPTPDPELFRHKATADILRILLDNPYEQLTIRELARLTDNAAQSVKRAVDTLEANGVITTDADGNRRLVSINRSRVTSPDEPVFRIPQSEFHLPVRTAVDRLEAELNGVDGVLVFGSVARGVADRQSDIDLWVLVDDRSGQQHHANMVAKELGENRFNGDRYTFQILVESPESARRRDGDLEEIFADGITLVDSDELRTLKREVLGSA
jgi:predicted nucleotidyltransferase